MVASEILSVKTAVPIIMGANIGTSLTSTIIAIGQIDDAEVYERAFAAATMHDMFNVLSVVVILPLESITQFLSRLSEIIAEQLHDIRSHDVELKILSRLTNPIISRIILVNRTIIEQISTSGIINKNERVLQIYAESWSDW
ncbi:sodium-dependent phosphate transport protein 2B-like, partial [Symsagittifera roscoffensis]|uniref:sodium-dependent phosphate transport protein 2B-like n=1 Tax=Symsagittifera roscoffensis TaxID=84072 RepID=UPI00307B1458